MKLALLFLLVLLVISTVTPAMHGDEGMWLFNNPPKKYLKGKYGFDATDKWLEHLQRSSVRFNSGGSGSFVSADGLVMTNHHVASDALQKMSTGEDKNYYRDGFLAKTHADEHKCEAMELNVLYSIEDVTEKVNAAVKPGMSTEDAFKARRAIMADIEKDSLDRTGLRSDVVTLYQGGAYHLYRFKKYTDVRLVFAPEQQIAFYGGDPDNFEYPRFDLDVAFFRVYENDKPAKLEHYLKWCEKPLADGELTFVSGHPGRTDRMSTVAELTYLRDIGFPYLMQRLNRWEVLLSTYSERSKDNAREAKEELFGVQNSRKARLGMLGGLQDPELMQRKRDYDKKLRDAADKDDKLKDARTAWDRVAKAEIRRAEIIKKHSVLEQGAGFNNHLFSIARTLVRAAEELPKKNPDRLRELRESNLESLKQELFSEEPIYDGFETVKLADGLSFLCAILGYDDPLTQQVLAGKSPRVRADEIMRGTKLKDVSERKRYWDGGKEAVEKSSDPLIRLALLVDGEARALRKIQEVEIEEAKRQAYGDIAKVKFAVEGTTTYPDATFTLRLAFGPVKGYEEGGKTVPAWTTFDGLYKKAAEMDNRPPYDLPKRWQERKSKLDLKVPFNFVSTADIIGGNSGSPVVNREGEVVGLIFDGNIQSLVLDFAYTDEQARAVSVAATGILEALRKVYDADHVADELVGKKK